MALPKQILAVAGMLMLIPALGLFLLTGWVLSLFVDDRDQVDSASASRVQGAER